MLEKRHTNSIPSNFKAKRGFDEELPCTNFAAFSTVFFLFVFPPFFPCFFAGLSLDSSRGIWSHSFVIFNTC